MNGNADKYHLNVGTDKSIKVRIGVINKKKYLTKSDTHQNW